MWQCSECGHDNSKTLAKCSKCESLRPAISYVGERISEWVIKRQLGEGGMAMVFLAHHTMLGNPVAIKLLRPEVTHKRDVVERFRTEALAASHLRHENVIQIIHFGKQEGIGTYMVLEFLEGMDLEAKMREAPLDASYILGVAKQLCAGLSAAHEAGIIHRDLKPSNIFLVPRANNPIPTVKILDFGIAKIQESHLLEGQQNLTRTGTVLGTPYYLSPEQLRRRKSDELGPSVDIYAFGVILYQMFTGQLPLEEATLAEQMAAILTRRPPLAGTIIEGLSGTALELYLHRLLDKNPNERPTSIDEAWEELAKATGVLGSQAKDKSLRQKWETTYQPQFTDEIDVQTPASTWLFRFVLVVLLLVGGGWMGYTFVQKPAPAPTQRQPTKRLSRLDQLQVDGAEAFDAKKYKVALQQWQKIINSKKFKKGSRTYNAKIYRSISVAWGRLKNRYASLQALKKYRDEVGEKNLTENERRRLKQLESEMQDKKKILAQSHKTFRNLLRKDKFRDALNALNSLQDQALKDPSQPQYIQTSLLMAKELAQRFPRYAVVVYNDLERFNYAIQDPSMKAQIAARRKQLLERMEVQRQTHLTRLREQISPKRLNPRSYQWKRSIDKTLNKLLFYPDDVAAHKSLLQLTQEFLQPYPQRTKVLLERYLRLLRSYQKKPGWQFWLKPVLNKANIKAERITETLGQIKRMNRAVRLDERMKRLVQRARLTQASKLAQKLLKEWNDTCKGATLLKEYCTKQRKQAEERATRLKEMIPQWKTIRRMATVTNEFKKAKSLFLRLNQKLSKLDWVPPHHQMVRLVSQWERKHRKAQMYFRKARSSERKKKWFNCWSNYRKYLKMYPRARNASYARYRQCRCNCSEQVPFEPCPKSCRRPSK